MSCIEAYLIPSVTILGILGNLVTTSILQSPSMDMKKSFRHILIMLAVFDTLFCLLAALTFSLPLISQDWRLWVLPLLLPWFLPGLQISLNGSIWSTVMVAIERYVSVAHQNQRYNFGS